MSEKAPVFKSQSYFRLLSFVKPYKTILIIGIVAGILTGGLLGASFFWLKGFIDPFQKQASHHASLSSSATTPGYERGVQLESSSVAPPEIGGTTMKADSSKASTSEVELKGQAKSLDSIITYAQYIGIPMLNSNGMLTMLGLFLFVISFVIVWMLKSLATYLNSYCMRWVGQRVVTDMRNKIFEKLMDQSLEFYGKMDVGHLISRVMQDTDQIQSAVSNNIADLTSTPFQIAGCIGYIIFASLTNDNFVLLFILIVTGVLMILPVVLVGKKVRRTYKASLHKISIVFSRMHEVFSGIILVKASNTEKKELEEFTSVNNRYFKTLIRSMRAQLLMSPLTELLGVVAIAIFFIYAFLANITLSDMIVLIVPALLCYQPIKTLAKVNNGVMSAMSGADRFFALLDTDCTLKEIESPVRVNDFKDKIVFDNVTFNYGADIDVLKEVSFELKKGQVVAVVGETGSGKSTIANLLARFYDLTGGSITLDGVELKNYKISDIRKLIGIVTQNTILFNDTIANNIAYGNSNATQHDIIEAAKRANAHKFIEEGNHSDGYNTVVGEKGFLLSGGEKQRIAIARAILKNPPILILDEATSALDTVTEKLVQEALNNLMENRTVFAIAHRLSTIKHADTILVIDKGRIIESGSHDELMAREHGHYKNLHDIQFDR